MTISLKNKILITFSGLFLMALLAQAYYFTPATRQRLIEHSLQDQLRIAEVMALKMESSLKSAEHEIEMLADSLEHGPPTRARMDEVLVSAEGLSNYFKTFYVVDMQGRWVSFPKRPDFVGKRLPQESLSWVEEAFTLNKTMSLDVSRSRIGTLVSGFAKPLKFSNGHRGYLLRGVVVLSEENSLLQMVDMVKIGGSGFSFLVSNNGALLAHPNVEIKTADESTDYSQYQPVAALMRGEEGSMTYEYGGSPWVATYRKVSPLGWGLVVQQPLSEITASADRESERIIIFSGIALLISSIILLASIGISFRPLDTLLKGIKMGRKVDASRFPDDEVGQLARSFNSLFEEVYQSQKEKEILLAEMHHRVKNNMQTVSSLLMIQEDATDDPRVRKAFSESVARIRAMALVHEALYKSDDLSKVDMAEYTSQLLSAYRGGPASITSDIKPLRLSIRHAIPLGIIINELVSNALEHAFVQMGQGEVRVECSQSPEGDCMLVVSDNGRGLPEGAEMGGEKTLGLFLVKLFAGQLRGRINIERNGGTKFSIAFSPEQQAPAPAPAP